MPYTSYLSGELTIVPPLTDQEVQSLEFNEFFAIDDTFSPIFRLIDQKTIEPSCEDGTSIRDLRGVLQDIIDSLPGHDFEGYIEGEGEQNLDVWRLYVKNREVVKIEPEILWRRRK